MKKTQSLLSDKLVFFFVAIGGIFFCIIYHKQFIRNPSVWYGTMLADQYILIVGILFLVFLFVFFYHYVFVKNKTKNNLGGK